MICGCGRWMHTAGIEERQDPSGTDVWFVRSECLGCGLRVGVEEAPAAAGSLVDRLLWTDEARHRLERMPPYVEALVRPAVEDYVRAKGQRVVTERGLAEARRGGAVEWESEAEQRLHNIPGPVRAMAKMELERTAGERGYARVTVALMEELKARYFGMGGKQ